MTDVICVALLLNHTNKAELCLINASIFPEIFSQMFSAFAFFPKIFVK